MYVCVVPLATYNAHPNDVSYDTSCDIHISPGSHESGRAIHRPCPGYMYVGLTADLFAPETIHRTLPKQRSHNNNKKKTQHTLTTRASCSRRAAAAASASASAAASS